MPQSSNTSNTSNISSVGITRLTDSDIEAFAAVTNERYRVLESKINTQADRIVRVEDTINNRFEDLMRDVYELKTEVKTDSASRHQSTKNTIIAATATVLAGVIGITIAIITTLFINT